MKRVGIIFAMEEEMDAFKDGISIVNEYQIFDLKFYECIVKSVFCILVESGIGKVNAARTTQILIDNLKVDYIFNVGVAGGISDKLKIGDVVVGTNLVQHDFDLTGFNHEKGYIPRIGKFIKSDEYLIRLAQNTFSNLTKNHKYNYFLGTIASGDIFCTERKMAEKIHLKFEALCVEMEGASIAQVCFLSNIPFLILRSISDTPNDDNVVTYEKFLKEASININEALKLMLNKFEKNEL